MKGFCSNSTQENRVFLDFEEAEKNCNANEACSGISIEHDLRVTYMICLAEIENSFINCCVRKKGNILGLITYIINYECLSSRNQCCIFSFLP